MRLALLNLVLRSLARLRSGVMSVMQTEPIMPGVSRQLCELRLAHMDQRRVIPCFKVNLGQAIDALIDEHLEPIAFAYGWHCPVGAILEQPFDFAFTGHIDVCTEFYSQFRQAHDTGCRQYS